MFISSFSYAYWKYSDTQDLVNVVGTKCLQLTMHNEKSGITILDAVPTSDEKGKTQEGYTFTIKNTCNTIAYYQVNLEEIDETKRLEDNYIKVSLNESEGKLLSKYEEVNPTIKEENFTSDKSHKLTSDRLNPNEEKEYILKLWMDEETPAIEEVMNATFESKVSIIAVSKEEEELKNTITISYTEPEYYSKEIEEVEIHATSETYNLIEYSTDNKVWNSLEKEGTEETITQSYTKENTYPIYFKDEAGNIEEQEIKTNKLDQTPPEISIEETNDDEGAVVNITFNDPKSGLYEYKIKDEVSTVDIEEGWTLLEEANTQTIQYHSNVNKPIHITVKDKLENENTKDYDITKADTKGPEVTITNPKEGIWTSENVTIIINATDDISGVDKFYYRKKTDTNSEEWIEITNVAITEKNGTASVTFSETEESIYEFKVIDKLNNESEIKTSSIKIDKIPPSQGFSETNKTDGSNGWKKGISIVATGSDTGGSNIVSGKYCTGTSNCVPATEFTGTTTTISLSDGSGMRACATFKDNAGNESSVTCSSSYNVDKESPTFTGVSITNSGTSITATINGANDVTSKIKTYTFQLSNGTIQTSNSNVYTFTNLARGITYTVVASITDNAGNTSGTKTSNSITIPNLTVGETLNNIPKVSSGNGLYQVAHSGMSETQFNNTEYRYAGSNPNNYVTFNGEVAGWRIIGLVNTPEGQRIKLIRKTPYSTGIAWTGGNHNSWNSSSLQTTLNGTYYTGFSQNAKDMTDTITWNLGGYRQNGWDTVDGGYQTERGASVYGSNSKTWSGRIGLMYPSDYGWATSGGSTITRENCLSYSSTGFKNQSECKINDWLYDSSNYQWTISHRSSNNTYVFVISNEGQAHNAAVSSSYSARPVLYLKSSVKITGGTGAQGSPFTLSL